MTQPVILNPHEYRSQRWALYFVEYSGVRYAVVAQTEDDAISEVLWAVRGDTEVALIQDGGIQYEKGRTL